MVSVLFFLLLLPWQPANGENAQCRMGMYSQPQKVLVNSTFKSVTVEKGFIDCYDECLKTEGCKSMNMLFDCSECQLNNVTHCSSSAAMETNVNAEYSINFKYSSGKSMMLPLRMLFSC